MGESQRRHFCKKLGLGMNGSDSSFSRLCNFAVGPVLEPPDHIAHA